ncbi:ankyrin repeat-containing domain protein [Xylaria acuta]|nr:ankyrin repeat-containing domain protein [Xylaria acuta]
MSDEERANDGNGTADTQDLPRYSESEATTYHKDDAARRLPTRTAGEGSDPTSHDGARNEKGINHSDRDDMTRYFTAIREGNNKVITSLLETTYVTTDIYNRDGFTPLLAAVDAGHIETVRFLLEAGADPNAYGVAERPGPRRYTNPPRRYLNPPDVCRTPLQLAAARGNLPMVRLLMETYHADDALIAPDGELALSLASANSHGEVVAYLPARRGGGFRRWRARHDSAIRSAKRTASGVRFLTYHVPKFFVWSIPKHFVVLPIVKRVRCSWRGC